MTVQEVIDKLNSIKDKSQEVIIFDNNYYKIQILVDIHLDNGNVILETY